MRDLKWYEGKAADNTYREIFPEGLVQHPSREDFIEYMIIYTNAWPSLRANKEKLGAYLKDGFDYPSKISPLVNAVTKEGDEVVVKFIENNEKWKNRQALFANQRSELLRLFKEDLQKNYLPNDLNAVHDIIYSKAWEDGHHAGLSQVLEIYEDMVEVVEDCLKVLK